MEIPEYRPLRVLAPSVGRCFQTAADGRIALTRNWATLLREGYRAGRMGVQTGHAFARLIAVTDLGELALRAGGASAIASDRSGTLEFHFAQWDRAWGFLRSCACCGSTGRLEVWNRAGAQFLQLSAVPGSDPHAWSDYLAVVTAPVGGLGRAGVAEPAALSSVFLRSMLSRARVRLPFDPESFVALLTAFGDEGVAVGCTVSSDELIHRRDFVPRCVSEEAGVVSAGEDGASLQFAWPAARELALTSDENGLSLRVIGVDDLVLLTLSAAANPLAAASWRGALSAAFPGLQ
jgi:hypothetical protein